MSSLPLVFLPVETISRELDSRLLLALHLTGAGRRVLLGHSLYLLDLAKRSRNAVYVGKGVLKPFHADDLRDYVALSEAGTRIVHLEEEGAVYFGEEDDWKQVLLRRLDASRVDPKDYICTWGDFQRQVYVERNPRLGDHLVTTGHPRFDLYGPDLRSFYAKEADVLRHRHGRFLLLNTNQGRANHQQGIDYAFTEHLGYHADDGPRRLEFVRTWAYSHRMLAHFVELAHHLRERFRDLTIVIRPHPSEAARFYETATRGLAGVHVERSGPVGPWLLASAMIVHDGCTTALEGYLCGIPVVCYRPEQDPRSELFLPNSLSRLCRTLEQVSSATDEALTSEAWRRAPPSPRARQLLANLESPSTPRLLRVIDSALGEVDGLPTLPSDGEQLRFVACLTAVESAKRLIRPAFPARQRSASHSRQKFPGLDAADVQSRISRLAELIGKPLPRIAMRGKYFADISPVR